MQTAWAKRITRGNHYLIASGFVVMLALIIAVTAYSLIQMRTMQRHMATILHIQNEKIRHVGALRNVARERSLTLFRIVASRDPFDLDELQQRMSRLAQQFLGLREKLLSQPLQPNEKVMLDQALGHALASTTIQTQIIKLVQNESYAEASKLLAERSIPTQNRLIEMYDDLLQTQREQSSAEAQRAAQNYQQAFTTTLGVASLLILLGLIISSYVIYYSRRAEKQLQTLNAELEQRVQSRTEDLQLANMQLHDSLSALKNTQAQLVQSEKMAALGSLVAGIAHEINTPIGVSITSASCIEEDTAALLAAMQAGSMRKSELEHYLQHTARGSEIMLNNLHRAADLIGSFKQVAVDQSRDEWRTITLHSYLREVLLSLQPRLKPAGVEPALNCAENLMFYSNPGALFQIFSNLILNSLVHAFAEHTAPVIEISCTHDNKHIDLIYRDNGCGIPPEHLNRVFEPFFTTRLGQGGSGLGLNIVYNLVTGPLKGSIRVESILKQGTTFHIQLPLLEAEQGTGIQ